MSHADGVDGRGDLLAHRIHGITQKFVLDRRTYFCLTQRRKGRGAICSYILMSKIFAHGF